MRPIDTSRDSQQQDDATKKWIAAALLGRPDAVDGFEEGDSEQIAKLAIANGVAPLLHHVLSQSDSWAELPRRFRENLLRPVRQAVAVDMLREQDLGRLLQQLHEAGVAYLLIKGAGLAYTHYERPFLRERCDTDILFAGQDAFDQAWVLLESLGYQRRNTLSGEFVGYQHCCWRAIGPGASQVLDCHIKINDYLFYADAFGFDELMEHSVAVPQLAESARTLGPVHALLLACMHRVGTIPMADADRLIWLYDMYVLAESFGDDDWRLFMDLARERAVGGSCKHSLDAACEFFPVPVPVAVMDALEKAADIEPFKPGMEMKRWQYYFQVFKSTRGAGKKLRLLREHFLPSSDYLMEKYHTRNRLALPFLYVHRVFAGLKRYF